MMAAPVITIIVRHSEGCKYEGDEFCKRCDCRKHFRWTQDGKQHRQKAGTRSWIEAEEIKRRLEDHLAGRTPSKAEGRTLSSARESFLQAKKVKGISPVAYKRYERVLLRLEGFCIKRGVFMVTGVDVELLNAYKATWPETYPSSTTRALVQNLIRVFLNYCHAAGWITHVPKQDPVKNTEAPTMPLAEAEYKRLLGHAEGRTRAIIQLMRWSGLAIGDASCLRRECLVQHKKGVWHVLTERQKTGVHVRVPIPEDVAKEVLGAFEGGEYLFYAGTPRSSFSRERGREITRAFEAAGIRCEGNMVSHRLRDTFAVDLLGKGVSMEDVSKLLGHTTITTTEKHYAPWVASRQDRLTAVVTGSWKRKR